MEPGGLAFLLASVQLEVDLLEPRFRFGFGEALRVLCLQLPMDPAVQYLHLDIRQDGEVLRKWVLRGNLVVGFHGSLSAERFSLPKCNHAVDVFARADEGTRRARVHG